MADTRHEILEVVELLVGSGRWQAGTIGTVVEADDQLALVEISDDRGHALDSSPSRIALWCRAPDGRRSASHTDRDAPFFALRARRRRNGKPAPRFPRKGRLAP